jgi:hypothetical protein
MKRSLILAVLTATGLAAIHFGPASAQRSDATATAAAATQREMSAAVTRGEELARARIRFNENNEKPLAQPFRGITTNGQIEPGLFPIRATGVSTEPVRRAVVAFLASLSPEQQQRAKFPIDDIEWRKWANQDLYIRQGVGFLEMNDRQRDLAFKVLRAGLSTYGFNRTRDIMRLNQTLAELTGNNVERFGEWNYFMTVMGEPSKTQPWGWQFDGHHSAINYFALGDQVVMTPVFAGSEPVIARAGKYQGIIVLQEELKRGLALINALPEALQKVAILSDVKPRQMNMTEAFHDNVDIPYQGVRAADLPPRLRQQLVDLIALHVSPQSPGHARVRMEEVTRHLDRTTFAWMGQRTDGAVFYYRIQSPVILIEFDHQPPFALRSPGGPTEAQYDHIHVVVRTPNGNDYGRDLLRQHYAQHPHG